MLLFSLLIIFIFFFCTTSFQVIFQSLSSATPCNATVFSTSPKHRFRKPWVLLPPPPPQSVFWLCNAKANMQHKGLQPF